MTDPGPALLDDWAHIRSGTAPSSTAAGKTLKIQIQKTLTQVREKNYFFVPVKPPPKKHFYILKFF